MILCCVCMSSLCLWPQHIYWHDVVNIYIMIYVMIYIYMYIYNLTYPDFCAWYQSSLCVSLCYDRSTSTGMMWSIRSIVGCTRPLWSALLFISWPSSRWRYLRLCCIYICASVFLKINLCFIIMYIICHFASFLHLYKKRMNSHDGSSNPPPPPPLLLSGHYEAPCHVTPIYILYQNINT
jgi:hypothetical protein